jgi:caffeoyl-CoA O-methyltransferase
MKRRDFFRQTAAATGLAASFPFFAGETGVQAAPVSVSPETRALREAILADLDAKRQETRLHMLPEDGQFVNLIVQLINAQQVLEIGTFHGYSSLWIAMGLEQTGGKLTTIEIDPERVKIALANLTKAGVANRVECLEGDAHQVAKTVSGPFDVALIDADKDRVDDYFQTLFPKLKPGGVILVNHVIAFKDLMQNYLDLVQKHPDLITSTVSPSMKDAFSLSFKKR